MGLNRVCIAHHASALAVLSSHGRIASGVKHTKVLKTLQGAKMPKKLDHQKAKAALERLPADALQAVTTRIPAGLLARIHGWAERHSVDLAAALRDLLAAGLKAGGSPRLD